MQSPFPGMDPYLEDPAYWADFHHRFLDVWCEAVANALPDNYDARLDESVNLVQMGPAFIKLIYPDIALSREPRRGRKPSSNSGGTMLLEPTIIPHEVLDEVRQAYIEILHRPDRSLVTVLEMLSPFNKTGDGFDQYRAKRSAILGQKVNFVELDLLLAGTRPTLREPLPVGDYYAFVTREKTRTHCEVYAWTLRDSLPTIPVPLRVPDADIHIDLAEVFRDTYRRGRYARALRYGEQPVAPLGEVDLAWTMERKIAETGRA